MNLIFALLATRQYLSKDQIRETISDYRGQSQAAFERMFERDKAELRDLGIDIELGHDEPGFEDFAGYRILRDEAELPSLELTPEEAAVVGLAAQVWQHSGLASKSTTALIKLKSIGVEIDPHVLRMTEPRLSSSEPALEPILEATRSRTPIRFDYQRSGGVPEKRHVQPWGVLSWRDRWYLCAFDLDREATRVFRLSRVVGKISSAGPPGSYEVPAGTQLREIATGLFPSKPTREALLNVRKGRGHDLRRTAAEAIPHDEDFDQLRVRFADMAVLTDTIVSYGPDVVALSPPELRQAVIARLQTIAGVAS